MKATGVSRKIDELGRIVIPKEIRRNLAIRDGENLEITINDDAICLRKKKSSHEILDIGKKLINILSTLIDDEIILTNREKVIFDNKNNYMDLDLDSKLISLIDERESLFTREIGSITLGNEKIGGYFNIVPIISSMDSLGLILIISQTIKDYKIITKLIAKILAEKVDIC